jgi:hypothetical protein
MTATQKFGTNPITANTITCLLSKPQSGTYPVIVEGGESIIRDLLNDLRQISSGMNGQAGTLSALRSRVGIKAIVGVVEFFGGGGTLASQGIDPLTQVMQLREMWRDELASILGIPRLNARSGAHGGGGDVSVY